MFAIQYERTKAGSYAQSFAGMRPRLSERMTLRLQGARSARRARLLCSRTRDRFSSALVSTSTPIRRGPFGGSLVLVEKPGRLTGAGIFVPGIPAWDGSLAGACMAQ